MNAPVTSRPWFTNDRGEQVRTVHRGADDTAIGWYAPHPVGWYGERDSWLGAVATTKATEASMLEWIGASTG